MASLPLLFLTVLIFHPLHVNPKPFHAANNLTASLDTWDTRIVGGYPIDILDRPFQVSLQYFYRHLCGGSIISPRWIVSAAHCTQIVSVHPPLFAFTVRVGSSFVQSEGDVFDVSRVVDHPGYGNSEMWLDFDLTLIQVSADIIYSESVQPVVLPAPNAPLIPGFPCVVTGWGALEQGGSAPLRLHSVTVPLISISSCNDYYRVNTGTDWISENMMCAGTPYGGRDACQGDSGGPLTVDDILIGVVSWGNGCALPNYPGVYANVPALRSWITEVTGV